MSMEELLQALMGGGGAAKQRRAGSGDPLTDMLQGILGGGAASRQGGGLEDILGSVLGGTMGQSKSPQSSQGGLMDILGAVMGGGSGMQGPGTSPIVEGIAGKLGLPQGIAQMIVAFVIGKLLSNVMGGGGAAALPGTTVQPRSRAATPQQPQSFNLDNLLETMGQDGSMADELAQQTGLDAQTAQRGLQEVLGMIGAQSRAQGGSAPTQPKQSGLDNLLDSW